MHRLPGWLLKRAHDLHAHRIIPVFPPILPTSPAMYLIDVGEFLELHVVDEARTGIDGVTIPLTWRESRDLLFNLAGAISGRVARDIVTAPFLLDAADILAADAPAPQGVEAP